ncbi:hypothetical protein Poly51_44530 [Rubripirellula tenax]|uniref:Uncharacterized protein n=1 Tax=Rubripirellula tenax TaxID=2528015 RepID=A0A5C6EFJ2_9BACT|nr:hypothetical protein Poly51_44530 [Rubripirellula tenax]
MSFPTSQSLIICASNYANADAIYCSFATTLVTADSFAFTASPRRQHKTVLVQCG